MWWVTIQAARVIQDLRRFEADRLPFRRRVINLVYSEDALEVLYGNYDLSESRQGPRVPIPHPRQSCSLNILMMP
jgi:hypothetical protein